MEENLDLKFCCQMHHDPVPLSHTLLSLVEKLTQLELFAL